VGKADLHTHTRASDGLHTPTELVQMARDKGLEAVAVTDHDTVAGVSEAVAVGRQLGVDVLPGVEISTLYEGVEVHVLGYAVDIEDPVFLRRLEELRNVRDVRNRMIVERLQQLGIDIHLDEVYAKRQYGGNVGRPHIAAELVELGVVRTIAEAFDRFLAQGRPAYVPRPKLDPAEAIAVVKAAGGVPVLAHPGLIGDDRLVRAAIAAGVMGIEAYHTDHSELQQEFYARWGRDAGLVVTGGTDSHGPGGTRTVVPGSVSVGMDVVEKLKALSPWYQRTRGSLA